MAITTTYTHGVTAMSPAQAASIRKAIAQIRADQQLSSLAHAAQLQMQALAVLRGYREAEHYGITDDAQRRDAYNAFQRAIPRWHLERVSSASAEKLVYMGGLLASAEERDDA